MSTPDGFSDAERAAMQQRAAELRAMKGVKGSAKRAKEYEQCLAVIEGLAGSDRQIAERLHLIVSEEAPHLHPKTWYGFPSYARDEKVIVFYQPATKFDTRYGSIGFNPDAALDDGQMWPTSFAVLAIAEAEERRLRALVRKAAG